MEENVLFLVIPRKTHFLAKNTQLTSGDCQLVPRGLEVYISHLASTVGLGSIPAQLAILPGPYFDIRVICVLEMVSHAASGKFELHRNPVSIPPPRMGSGSGYA